jgi:hypothetical protein
MSEPFQVGEATCSVPRCQSPAAIELINPTSAAKGSYRYVCAGHRLDKSIPVSPDDYRLIR